MEELMVDMLRICPEAWYILVANPVMAGVTYLTRKYPQAKVVGLCHGSGCVFGLARLIGLDCSKLYFEIPGVNHFIWLNKFECDGQDAFPILHEWMEKNLDKHLEEVWNSSTEGPKAFDLYKKYGVFPIGDTCNTGGGSWGWWYHADDETEAKWKEDPYGWYDWFFGWGEDNLDKMNKVANDPNASVLELIEPHMSGEPMIPLIEALECGVERELIVNIPNKGMMVAGAPEDFAVEVTATISKGKIDGHKMIDLPKPVQALMLRDMIGPVEMELAAFESARYDHLLTLILMDPWTKSEEQARALIDEIMAIPHFSDMKEYYK